jgi:hypothetical protein
MISSYCCSMNCLKWLRLLNVPFKESCIVFIMREHIIVAFSFDALFGLTWCMLTPWLTLPNCHKPLWSFGFWLVIPLYALVNDVFSLCMIMAVIALLVGRSQSFASLHFVLRGNMMRGGLRTPPLHVRQHSSLTSLRRERGGRRRRTTRKKLGSAARRGGSWSWTD